MELEDLRRTKVAKDEIDAATKQGSAWIDCSWYEPRSNEPAHKRTYVKKVQAGDETFVVGSGIDRD